MGALDQVTQLKNEGASDEEIIGKLREQNISPKAINDAMDQSNIKEAVSKPVIEDDMEPYTKARTSQGISNYPKGPATQEIQQPANQSFQQPVNPAYPEPQEYQQPFQQPVNQPFQQSQQPVNQPFQQSQQPVNPAYPEPQEYQQPFQQPVNQPFQQPVNQPFQQSQQPVNPAYPKPQEYQQIQQPVNQQEYYEPQQEYYDEGASGVDYGGYEGDYGQGAYDEEYYPQEGYGQDYYGGGTDTMIEIAEQVFIEKTRKMQEQLEDLNEFKTLAETKLTNATSRLKRIEESIDKLQMAILEKVGSYGRGLDNIKKEMAMMQESFSKTLPVLASRHSHSATSHHKPAVKKKTVSRKR